MGSSAKSNEGLHVLFASPEVAPFDRTALAELSRVLPAEIRRLGVKISILTCYDASFDPKDHRLAERLTVLELPLDGRQVQVRVLEGRTSEGVRIFFLRSDELFSRSSGLDAGLRAGLFSRAVCEFVQSLAIAVDVIHCIGWQTGLVPVFLEECYAHSAKLASVTVLSTIADIAEQGSFSAALLPRLGLRESLNHPDDLEFYGKLCFLKGAILYSDLLNTLSPRYREDILQPEGGARLDGVLRKRAEDVQSVLLGVDTRNDNSMNDSRIAAAFEPEKLNGKQQCKAALQHELGLPLRPNKPVVAFVGPLVEQRGIDLVSDILDDLIDREVQLVFLGRGDAHYERAVNAWIKEFPKNVAARFDDDAAALRRFLSGSDLLLLPAAYVAFDQLHLIARRYGAVPVARRISCYADTLVSVGPDVAEPNAFLFDDFDPDRFYDAVMDALDLYLAEERWLPLVESCMRNVPSCSETAEALVEAYRQLL